MRPAITRSLAEAVWKEIQALRWQRLSYAERHEQELRVIERGLASLQPPTPPTPPTNPEPNPICAHEHREHYLGGGIWVCFACWASLMIGRSPLPKGSPTG